MKTAKPITSKKLLKSIKKTDRILLVNPPVHETRYSWLRWNQPLDLLQISRLLKETIGCRVDLFDYMLPSKEGKVKKQALKGMLRHRTIKEFRFPMWRFGRPMEDFGKWLAADRAGKKRWKKPNQVWITSLCSYWFDGVFEVARQAKSELPDAEIILIGQYPRLMPEHAQHCSPAHLFLEDHPPANSYVPDLDLYGQVKPPFAALPMIPDVAVSVAEEAVKQEITRFAFFTDDVCLDDGKVLKEIFERTKDLHKYVRFHVICGLEPDRFTHEIAKVVSDPQFAELHFEECSFDDNLNYEVYEQVCGYLDKVEIERNGTRTSGFVWIGKPHEVLESTIRRSFDVLKFFGNMILKPYTPVGTDDAEKYADYLDDIEHADKSPHMFPFAELNEITRTEYHDLYRMAAFLNEKVRNRSFDFLEGTIGAELLKNSLKNEAWKLEANPLRVID